MTEQSKPSPAAGAIAADPAVDVQQHLLHIIGETGGVENCMGGFRIKIFHTRAFPWDEVFKLLLYRDFKVDVTRKKADIYIEARL